MGAPTHEVQGRVHNVDQLQPLAVYGIELRTRFALVAPTRQWYGDRADGVACATDQMEELVTNQVRTANS